MSEQALQVWAWMAEIDSKEWGGDGEEVGVVYRSAYGRALCLDLDIALTQTCAVYHNHAPQTLCQVAVKQFGVEEVLSTGTPSPGKTLEWAAARLEALLSLLVTVVREQRHTGVGEEAYMKYECVQWLAAATLSHSQVLPTLNPIPVTPTPQPPSPSPHPPVCPSPCAQICDGLPSALATHPSLDKVLGEISVYRPPGLQEGGRYELKTEAWSEFDPLFAHFSPATRAAAQERAVTIGNQSGQWQPPRLPSNRVPPMDRLTAILHTKVQQGLPPSLPLSLTISGVVYAGVGACGGG